MSRIKIGLFLVIVVFVLSGCATTFINRGDRFLELGQYEKAIDSYNRALGFGESAIAYLNRGVAYCYLEKYERAIEDYNRAIKLEPKWRGIYVLRGLAYAAMKKYRTAIKDYNRAIELDPDQALPYHCRGLAYRDMKQYERAMQDFDVALEIEEKAVFYADKAVTLYWMGKSEESKRVYRMAIQLDDRWAGKFEELKKEGFMFRPEEYTAVKELWRMVETREIGYLVGKERPEQPEQETYAESLSEEEERLRQETPSHLPPPYQVADEEPAGEPRTGRRHYQATEEPESTPEPEYQRDLREYHQRDLKEALWMEILRYLAIAQAPYFSPQVEKMLNNQVESTTELCIEILRTEGKETLLQYIQDCYTYAYSYGYSRASIYQDPYPLALDAKLCAGLLLEFTKQKALKTIQEEQQAQEGGKFVWVKVKSLNIRDGPSTQHKVIDQAKYNDRLLAIEESGKWYKVKFVDGLLGWVYAPLCSKEAQKGSNKIFPLEINKEVREVVVPNVLGRRLGEAKEILERAGLKVGQIDYVCDVEKLFDIILRQEPRPGKTVPKSTPMNLTINAEEEE